MQCVLVSGDNWHAKHHAEVLIMNRDADGPRRSGPMTMTSPNTIVLVDSGNNYPRVRKV